MVSEENEYNENRMVIIGTIEESNDKQTKVQYEAISGSRTVWIPRDALVSKAKTHDGLTAFLVQSAELTHGLYNPVDQFDGIKAPVITEPEHIELAGALEDGVASANIKFLVKEQKSNNTPDLFSLSNNDEKNEPTNQEIDDFDDSVMPTSTEGSIDVGTMMTGGNDAVWGGALTNGGRDDLVAHDWRFTPTMKPLFTAHQESENMAPTFAPLADKKGEPIAFGVFNPTYASEARPEGALLATVGKDYFPLAYPIAYDPVLDLAAQNGWKAQVHAYNEGGKARLDCDVSQATQSKKLAAQRLKDGGHSWLSTNLMDKTARSLDGLYRYGFSINNSLDGTRALSVQAVAMRTYCTNLAVMGSSQTIASIRHKKGAMKDQNWDLFASKINDVIVDAQRQLVEMEFMQHIPVDTQLFERLITLCETKGLIGWPNKKPDIKNNKVVGEKLTGGHMWRLAMDGWTKPQNEWVNVSDEQSGTLYHAYNVLNGAITHKPTWTDGKQTLKGRTVGFETLNRRLSTVHDVMTGVLHQTVSDYRADAGVDRIGITDLSDMKAYVNEEGLSKLNDIPMASEVLNL
jgi:hypothetical protein|tara:strand:- start:3174 stop:4895 length:1722 start_codon:yes stop_codon:yes gene_type:complete